jgi:hypothetical protein
MTRFPIFAAVAIVLLTVFVSRPTRAAGEQPHSAITRPPAVPLVTHDPYFSCWSFADHLYDDWPKHWTGRTFGMCGLIRVDGKVYRWMGGKVEAAPNTAVQKSVQIKPLSSTFKFDCGPVSLEATFISPLVMTDLERMSEPVSYLWLSAMQTDGKAHDVQVYFDATAEWTVNEPTQKVQ